MLQYNLGKLGTHILIRSFKNKICFLQYFSATPPSMDVICYQPLQTQPIEIMPIFFLYFIHLPKSLSIFIDCSRLTKSLNFPTEIGLYSILSLISDMLLLIGYIIGKQESPIYHIIYNTYKGWKN